MRERLGAVVGVSKAAAESPHSKDSRRCGGDGAEMAWGAEAARFGKGPALYVKYCLQPQHDRHAEKHQDRHTETGLAIHFGNQVGRRHVKGHARR